MIKIFQEIYEAIMQAQKKILMEFLKLNTSQYSPQATRKKRKIDKQSLKSANLNHKMEKEIAIPESKFR